MVAQGAPPRTGSSTSVLQLLAIGLLVVVGTLVLSRALSASRADYVLGLALAFVVFVFVFMKTEAGLYLVLFSMLLSPEFVVGGGGDRLAEARQIALRSEDFLLLIIAFSWFAKTAVNKEIGLVLKTPLNRPILIFLMTTLLATLVGYISGTVTTAAGFFYVLKYVEYFFVYYMVANNVNDRAHAWRLIMAAFLTAAVVSLIGIAQIPSGERVSAPFEGEIGEPNTFGGYLLFMIALASGLFLESQSLRLRAMSLGLAALMTMPFAFTLSRASYLGAIPMVLTLALLTTRRKVALAALALLAVASPLLVGLVPNTVVNRVLYTFTTEPGQPTVRLGDVGFDPSTSERLISFQQGLEGWMRRPLLGFGVTGFKFMDAQYIRVLVETGIVGFAAFLWLMWATLRSGLGAFRNVRDPDDRGIALGFVAGLMGLLGHAVGSNTFIIIRIMEPFWFFAAAVIALPTFAARAAATPSPPPVPARKARAVVRPV